MPITKTLKIIFSGLLIALLIVSFGSCRKKLKGENLLYEGTWTDGATWTDYDYFGESYYDTINYRTVYPTEQEWHSGPRTIGIEANGKAYYTEYSGGFSKEINGKVKIKKDKLIIKFSVIKEEFTITKSPTKDNLGYYMVLNADTFRQID